MEKRVLPFFLFYNIDIMNKEIISPIPLDYTNILTLKEYLNIDTEAATLLASNDVTFTENYIQQVLIESIIDLNTICGNLINLKWKYNKFTTDELNHLKYAIYKTTKYYLSLGNIRADVSAITGDTNVTGTSATQLNLAQRQDIINLLVLANCYLQNTLYSKALTDYLEILELEKNNNN